MRRLLKVCALTLAWYALIGAARAPAEDGQPYLYRFKAEQGRHDRFVGDHEVGSIGQRRFELDIDDFYHTRLLALEYQKFDNDVPDSAGLELEDEKFAFGADWPVGKHCDLKVAANVFAYPENPYVNPTGEDYWAWGVYPTYHPDGFALATGVERDQARTFLSYGYLKRPWRSGNVSLGASREETFEGHMTPTRVVAKRFGGNAILASQHGLLCFGSTYNSDTERFTWLGGLARLSTLDDRNTPHDEAAGMNPGAILIGRFKPEAKYGLAIVGLWKSAVNARSCPGMMEAFYRGTFNTTRVVRNRDFGTPGVSSGYDTQDFGRIALAVTAMDITVGSTAHLRDAEVDLYGTLPGRFGPVHDPYLGVWRGRSTDLLYDPSAHRLNAVRQDYVVVVLGTKFVVRSPATYDNDPRGRSHGRKQSGYLRLEALTRFDETFQGVTVTGTYWY